MKSKAHIAWVAVASQKADPTYPFKFWFSQPSGGKNTTKQHKASERKMCSAVGSEAPQARKERGQGGPSQEGLELDRPEPGGGGWTALPPRAKLTLNYRGGDRCQR